MWLADSDAFGPKGPENALIPEGPKDAAHEESLQPEWERLEEALGFVGDRADLKELSDAEFARAAGSLDGRMHEELFAETVWNNWSLGLKAAHACFVAGGQSQLAQNHGPCR